MKHCEKVVKGKKEIGETERKNVRIKQEKEV